ncbi:hypothetical protein ZIOFF_032964 [Zingiber officinale]|uniref:Uncharacterized protein n=1 Tax=Zingiber officinale TaxID=94328 RepID=A0A8J5GH54_ZINOF|nr:hypothetical protein ZIOFF_032964 [Zingiber officinale]
MGLQLVKPYLGGGGADDFRHGANFAVAGATSLDVDYFLSRGIENLYSNNSLSVQLPLVRAAPAFALLLCFRPRRFSEQRPVFGGADRSQRLQHPLLPKPKR